MLMLFPDAVTLTLKRTTISNTSKPRGRCLTGQIACINWLPVSRPSGVSGTVLTDPQDHAGTTIGIWNLEFGLARAEYLEYAVTNQV